MNPFQSIRSRLLLPLAVAVLGICLLSGYHAVVARSQEKKQTQTTAMRLASHIAVEQQQYIEDARQLLATLSQMVRPALTVGGDACNRILNDIRKNYAQYLNIGVIDADGRVTCSALPFDEALRLDHRDYFRQALASGNFSLGSYQTGAITGRPSINAGYPLTGASGNVDSVLFVAIDLNWLSGALARVPLPKTTIISMVSGEGIILTRYPDDGGIGTPFGQGYTFPESSNAESGVGMFTTHKGEDRLFASAPLPDGKGARVIVSIAETEAYGETEALFVRQLVGLVLVAIVVAGASWLLARRLVLHPVASLIHASRQLGSGNLKARVQLTSPVREIIQLAESFDTMAASLEERVNQIELQDAELCRANRALQTVSAGNHALLRAADEQGLLNEMCQVAVDAGGYCMAWVAYVNTREEFKISQMAHAGFAKGFDWDSLSRTEKPAFERSSTGYAISSGKAVVIHRLMDHTPPSRWREFFQLYEVRSGIILPLIIDGQVIGIFSIYASDENAFDDRGQVILEEMSEDLAFGIKSLRTRQEKEKAESDLRYLAFHDPVTDLPNYRQMEIWLDEAVKKARNDESGLALVSFALDRIQETNATLGFDIANRLFREAATKIRKHLLGDEKIARFQNEEIVVLIPNADGERAEIRAKDLVGAVNKQRHLLEDFTLTINARAGIVLYPEHGLNTQELLQQTGTALQMARDAGEECIFYSPKMDKYKKYRLALAGKLHEALENDQIQLHYQPKICMETGSIIGVEALARWHHPENGMIPPDVFIDVAENTGLINRLSRSVLEKTMHQMTIWKKQGIHLPIAVNLSPQDLLSHNLIEYVVKIFHDELLKAGLLEIEITERAIITDPDFAQAQLEKLREMGVVLYLDDFGTGFSSLATLKRLPFDAIKIDKSFVQDVLTDSDAKIIVRSTILLAKELHLSVTAEGIETEEIWFELKRLGCQSAQGYYMAKPMPPEQLENWLQNHLWQAPDSKG